MSALPGTLKVALAAGACWLSIGVVHAAPIDWNVWTSATGGTIAPDSIGVTFTIAGTGSVDNLVPNYPSYKPTTTFADGSVVNNAPVMADGIIQLVGGYTNVNTVTFSKPVINPVMAIWSLGRTEGVIQAEFDFINATPVFVAGGPSAEYGGSSITISGNNVLGAEGNGTVQFIGTFTSVSWTNPVPEFWYGFDVGIPGRGGSGVPEPSTLTLFSIALLPLAASLGRRGRRYITTS